MKQETDMNIEERLEQVATVINQIDDPKVPRNIRRQAKEAREQWLLNKGKKLDVRIAMAQSKLEELCEDPNIPPEFGTLILTINTELERILTEVLDSLFFGFVIVKGEHQTSEEQPLFDGELALRDDFFELIAPLLRERHVVNPDTDQPDGPRSSGLGARRTPLQYGPR